MEGLGHWSLGGKEQVSGGESETEQSRKLEGAIWGPPRCPEETHPTMTPPHANIVAKTAEHARKHLNFRSDSLGGALCKNLLPSNLFSITGNV